MQLSPKVGEIFERHVLITRIIIVSTVDSKTRYISKVNIKFLLYPGIHLICFLRDEKKKFLLVLFLLLLLSNSVFCREIIMKIIIQIIDREHCQFATDVKICMTINQNSCPFSDITKDHNQLRARRGLTLLIDVPLRTRTALLLYTKSMVIAPFLFSADALYIKGELRSRLKLSQYNYRVNILNRTLKI